MEPNPSPYASIISHNDLDGVASAALCSQIFDVEEVTFTGPSQVDQEVIDETTIVCDLPYTRACGLWFDHHMANRQELLLRKIDPATIPGSLADKPSCLHVIYDFFVAEYAIEEWLPFMHDVDIVDSFLYANPGEWLKSTPVRILDSAIKHEPGDRDFLRRLMFMLREDTYTKAAADNEVANRARLFMKNEESQIELMRKTARFLDTGNEIILLDLTGYQNPPTLLKNLAFIVHPRAKTVLEVRCRYEQGIKTNDLYLSMSLGFADEKTKAQKDLGEIMRELNIGNGHPGSAAGQIKCTTKAEREKALSHALGMVRKVWERQTGGRICKTKQ